MRWSKAISGAMVAITILAHAGMVHALDTCKAKVRGKDGTILISAKNVDGTLQWGWSAGTEDNAFSDPACASGTSAKNCTQGVAASLLAITAPPECNIYLADNSGSCTAYVNKCQPGKRPVVEFPTRFIVHGDGTVTDTATGLMWQQTTDDSSIRDKDNTYTWTFDSYVNSLYNPDGTAFFYFLATLNGTTPFAGHGDWRLPSLTELKTIVDLTAPGCGGGSACIDQTVFGPTQADNYWSATSSSGSIAHAHVVDFGSGSASEFMKDQRRPYARAVRGGS